jgi:hypothetical protein
MLKSRSVVVHLLRGLLGFGLLAVSSVLFNSSSNWAIVPFVLGLVALRGCPTCWTLGLIETVYAKLTGRAVDACTDGSCAT